MPANKKNVCLLPAPLASFFVRSAYLSSKERPDVRISETQLRHVARKAIMLYNASQLISEQAEPSHRGRRFNTQQEAALARVAAAVMEFLSDSSKDPTTLNTIAARAEVTGEDIPKAKNKAKNLLSLVADAFKNNYHDLTDI